MQKESKFRKTFYARINSRYTKSDTGEKAYSAVKENPAYIKFIDNPTTMQIYSSLSKYPDMIRFIPDKCKTNSNVLEFVQQKPEILQYIPSEFQTIEMAYAASQDEKAATYIAGHLLDELYPMLKKEDLENGIDLNQPETT